MAAAEFYRWLKQQAGGEDAGKSALASQAEELRRLFPWPIVRELLRRQEKEE